MYLFYCQHWIASYLNNILKWEWHFCNCIIMVFCSSWWLLRRNEPAFSNILNPIIDPLRRTGFNKCLKRKTKRTALNSNNFRFLKNLNGNKRWSYLPWNYWCPFSISTYYWSFHYKKLTEKLLTYHMHGHYGCALIFD